MRKSNVPQEIRHVTQVKWLVSKPQMFSFFDQKVYLRAEKLRKTRWRSVGYDKGKENPVSWGFLRAWAPVAGASRANQTHTADPV